MFNLPFPIPKDIATNIQIFTRPSTIDGEVPWIKPQGAKEIYLFGVAGGGGGGNGSVGKFGYNSGGGGGSSATAIIYGPASIFPDYMTMVIGTGGATASAGTATKLFYPDKNTSLLTINPGAAGTTGANGVCSPGGAGGAVSTSVYFTGFLLSIAGITGGQGESVSTSSCSASAPVARNINGGSGGRDSSNFQPDSTSYSPLTPLYPNIDGGTTIDGYSLIYPFLFSTGGSGGISQFQGAGNGGYGSGGGGGGWTHNTNTGTPGGFGGQGLIIIACW
jgi:hypothetical protein